MALDNSEITPAPKQPFTRYTLWDKLRGVDREDKRLLELSEQVVNKLRNDIIEGGKISFFHRKATGKLETVICTVYLTSPKIPFLDVELWNESVPPSQEKIDWYKKFFGAAQGKRVLKANEDLEAPKGGRSITFIQRWDTPNGSYELNYLGDYMNENSSPNSSKSIPHSNKEKIAFLEEILETTVDQTNRMPPFQEPYTPGAVYSGGDTGDGRVHHACWVRDMKNLQNSGFLGTELPKLPE